MHWKLPCRPCQVRDQQRHLNSSGGAKEMRCRWIRSGCIISLVAAMSCESHRALMGSSVCTLKRATKEMRCR